MVVVLLSEVGDVLWGWFRVGVLRADAEECTMAVGDDTVGFGARVSTDTRPVLVWALCQRFQRIVDLAVQVAKL